MRRAGREPAEDVKRRLVAACQEAGLEVSEGCFRLLKDLRVRFVMVCASLPGWPHEIPMVTIQTWVSTSGETFPIQIYCQATKPEKDPEMNVFATPLMDGRKSVSPGSLVENLQETLLERAQVLRALDHGEIPPFAFDETVWDLPSFFNF